MNAVTKIDVAPLTTWAPENGLITIRDGRTINVTQTMWVIPHPVKTFRFDWTTVDLPDGDVLNALRRWIAHMLRNQAVQTSHTAFRLVSHLLVTPAFREAARTGDAIPYLAFSQALASLVAGQRWQLHYARVFYRWCKSQGFAQFTDDVARRLDTIVIGGNAKGEAVRSADPDKGPLDAMEVASLALALRAARIENTMPLREQAAVWLCLAFGANASQYAFMREEDIKPQIINEQRVATLIQVPRHKKGDVKPRTGFQTRKANRFIGRILEDLIAENAILHRPNDPGAARPLLWRDEPRDRGSGMEAWAWHLDGAEFTELLQKAVKRLRVLSRNGGLLRISARRLRYSMASRMVQDGASKWAVAVALDHTDLQNVDTYFDIASDIVPHLDRATAMTLAARVQAFAKIVETEEDAVNGGTAASRRYFGDREKELFEPIGTCGHTSLRNVVAPYGCYVCPKFQAWMDGPHDLVLDALVESRQRREDLGLNPHIIGVEDELIAHVANVITRIGEMRELQAAA